MIVTKTINELTEQFVHENNFDVTVLNDFKHKGKFNSFYFKLFCKDIINKYKNICFASINYLSEKICKN